MGLTFSRLFGRKEMRILMVGLEGGGKTTILYKLKMDDVVTTIPTIGFNVETVERKNTIFTIWDIGGKDRLRPLYKHYYDKTQGLILVVDSTDTGHFDAARNELYRLLNVEQLRDSVLLVFANKQDLTDAISVEEMTDNLGLHGLPPNRRWNILPCSATTGNGLLEGLDWLNSTFLGDVDKSQSI